MTRALAALLLCAALAPRAVFAQELGRLFFTPAQRAALDERRRSRLPDKPAVVAPLPTTRMDGSVWRSSGKSTIWLDGFAVREGSQPEGLRIRRSRDPSRVTVTVGEDGRRVDLRVGQSLDRASGEVRDVISDGALRIDRGGARPR
jgi:hypothetical protein